MSNGSYLLYADFNSDKGVTVLSKLVAFIRLPWVPVLSLQLLMLLPCFGTTGINAREGSRPLEDRRGKEKTLPVDSPLRVKAMRLQSESESNVGREGGFTRVNSCVKNKSILREVLCSEHANRSHWYRENGGCPLALSPSGPSCSKYPASCERFPVDHIYQLLSPKCAECRTRRPGHSNAFLALRAYRRRVTAVKIGTADSRFKPRFKPRGRLGFSHAIRDSFRS